MVVHLTPLSPQILRLLKGLLCPAGTNYTQHRPSCMVRCVSFVPARQRSSSEREMWEVCGRQAPRDRSSDWGRSRVCSSPASSPNAYKKGEAEGLLPWWPTGKPAVATAGLALLLVLLWSARVHKYLRKQIKSHTLDVSICNAHNLTTLGTI